MIRTSRMLAAMLLGSSLLTTGCLMPPVAPLDESVSEAGLAEDETHLWKRAGEARLHLDQSGMRIDDPVLDEYLENVAASLGGDAFAAADLELRVRVLSDPDMNAFAFPDGGIYVHTALLARMENEAQLATMLSREMAHILNRHALAKHRADRRTGNALAMTGLIATAVDGGSYAQMLLQAGQYSSMGGYHQALEMRADADGLAMMDATGYDLNQAPLLYELTMSYLEEVAAQRGPPPFGFAFSKPMHVKSRIAACRKLLATDYAASASEDGRILNTSRFNDAVHAVRVHQAGLELDRGRFDSALRTAEIALDTRPGDAEAWVVVGEARLASKSRSDRDGAIEAWERALSLDRNHAGAHRALGLLYYRDFKRGGESRRESEVHLARYLRAAPGAPDEEHVMHYLRELRAEEEGT